MVADGSEVGHCFGSGGLRAPPVEADEANLAIVLTYFFLLVQAPRPTSGRVEKTHENKFFFVKK